MNARMLAVVMGVALAGQAFATGAGKNPQQSQGSMQQDSQQSQGSTQQDQQQAQGSMQQEGKAQGSAKAGQDPLMKPGSPVKGHASDQVVTGRIAKLTDDSVQIEAKGGQSKALQIAPETLIDGKADNREALKEGQQIRASFNQVEGKDVAVEIHSTKRGGTGSEAKQSGSQRGSDASSGSGSQSGGASGSQSGGSSGSQGGSTQQK